MFNSNLIVIFIIVSSYKFTSIPYYTYPVFDLEYL